MEINLLHGDCLEMMKDIPDKSVDMILCDLPYGTTQNKWDSIIPLDELWGQYERIIKERGAIVLTAQTPFDKVLGVSNLKLLRYEWIWDKRLGTGHLNAKKMPMKRHENILVFYKKLPTYNPQMTGGKPYDKGYGFRDSSNYGKQRAVSDKNDTGLRYPTSILDHSNANRRGKVHPTQKPVELMEYLIKTYTNEGETVLDNCMGSGTTGVACVNTNRNFIGIELDDECFEIAKQRISEARNKPEQITMG
jgi:site-specific DNA-methyltransferase (adenine-specific)